MFTYLNLVYLSIFLPPLRRFLHEDDESMSLIIKNVTSADAGEYLVVASNELGEDSSTMHLIVKAAPKIKKKVENQTCMVSILLVWMIMLIAE